MVNLEVVETIFRGDNEIGHTWVNLEGIGDEIERWRRRAIGRRQREQYDKASI